MKKWLACFCVLMLCTAAQATDNAHENCWIQAANRHAIHPSLLYAIAKQESGLNPMARGTNTNGSYDIGLMQINSSHLPLLARYGIDERHLYDACVSIHVGAWLLADNFRRMGYNWSAVGAYNATSPDKRLRYAHRIAHQLQKSNAAQSSQAGPAPR
jgi:soluble lytic murein transglycosylase-like protein